MSTERVIVDKSIAKDFEAALRVAGESVKSKRFDLVRKGAVEDLKSTVDDAIEAVSRRRLPRLFPLFPFSEIIPTVIHLGRGGD